MTKTPIPLRLDDVTPFVRALSQQLGETSPSHLALMNKVARAAGFQNIQHMRAASAAAKRLDARTVEVTADARTVERALHQFDPAGRLLRWPSKRAVQTLALWGLWSAMPANRSMTEQTVNEILGEEHRFSDPATLRRSMIACGLLTRKRDGTDYRRIERKPPAEAKAVIQRLSARRIARLPARTEVQDA
ncbi:MAG: DUF2087 domain-containing protein [Pseudomonadota bacterium]